MVLVASFISRFILGQSRTYRLRLLVVFFFFFLLGGDGDLSSELDDFTNLQRKETDSFIKVDCNSTTLQFSIPKNVTIEIISGRGGAGLLKLLCPELVILSSRNEQKFTETPTIVILLL